jgi:hypothetical protein
MKLCKKRNIYSCHLKNDIFIKFIISMHPISYIFITINDVVLEATFPLNMIAVNIIVFGISNESQPFLLNFLLRKNVFLTL